eukprot:2332-Heterococcus_DN1.PRE.1
MQPLRDLGANIITVKSAAVRPITAQDFVRALAAVKPTVSAASLAQFERWENSGSECGQQQQSCVTLLKQLLSRCVHSSVSVGLAKQKKCLQVCTCAAAAAMTTRQHIVCTYIHTSHICVPLSQYSSCTQQQVNDH